MFKTVRPRRRPAEDLLFGALSGAAGSAALNMATYLDIAVRGRAPSEVPAKDVDALADRAGASLGASEKKAQHRREALGALLGYASGVGVALVHGLVGHHAVALPFAVRAGVVGAGAMAATDVASTALGVTQPTTWPAQSWIVDALPHLAYGAVTVTAYDTLKAGR
jgi:hypothetical protein